MRLIAERFRPIVAFQGERGAFSEEAAIELLGAEIELLPRRTFAELFEAIDLRLAQYGVIPVENSLVGTIQICADLLQKHQSSICGDVRISIAQHLIGRPGVAFKEIKTVESHPVALAQCKRFLAEHPHLQAIEAYDTAGSVARIMANGDRTRGAIAGARAAYYYGASIVREHVEDDRNNFTRFVLVSARETGQQWKEVYSK